MARSQQVRGLIDHTEGTVSKTNVARMEESVEMARLQPVMGLINHTTEDVNTIFGGDGGGYGVQGGFHGKGHSSRHGWMSHGCQECGTKNDLQQQEDNWSHHWMRHSGVQEYDRYIGRNCCHYFPVITRCDISSAVVVIILIRRMRVDIMVMVMTIVLGDHHPFCLAYLGR